MENEKKEWVDSTADQYIQEERADMDEELPIIRGRGVATMDFETVTEACSLAGLKSVKRQVADVLNSACLREKYKTFPGIRKTWADCSSLFASGLPVPLQFLVEGKSDYEQEIVNYCKLAGLKYKLPKEKMKAEIEKLKSEVSHMTKNIMEKLEIIVSQYKQLESESF